VVFLSEVVVRLWFFFDRTTTTKQFTVALRGITLPKSLWLSFRFNWFLLFAHFAEQQLLVLVFSVWLLLWLQPQA
jgi:hypothetical protein